MLPAFDPGFVMIFPRIAGQGVRLFEGRSVFNFILLWSFVDKLSYPHQLIQLLPLLPVAIFIFIGYKHFVFKDNQCF